jgi:hypothetical protein
MLYRVKFDSVYRSRPHMCGALSFGRMQSADGFSRCLSAHPARPSKPSPPSGLDGPTSPSRPRGCENFPGSIKEILAATHGFRLPVRRMKAFPQSHSYLQCENPSVFSLTTMAPSQAALLVSTLPIIVPHLPFLAYIPTSFGMPNAF